MYLQLVREQFTKEFTKGKLFVNGTFACYTLEDTDRFLEEGGKKVYGKTAIPRGTYNIVLTLSNRFGKVLPLLESVEGFTGVRIHTGNTSEDTEGCILVGSVNRIDSDDFIGASKAAFSSLMSHLTNARDAITLEIV